MDLNLPESLMHNAELHDTPIEDDSLTQVYYGASTPDITSLYADSQFLGGPVYVQLKERIEIKNVDQSGKHNGATTSYIETI